MSKDRQGHFVTGTADSAAALDRAIGEYYRWRGDPLALLRDATARDPAFTLGHSAAASLLLLGGAPGDSAAVNAALAGAAAHIGGATRREHLHLEAARAWSRGGIVRAAAIWEEILLDHPTDALALRFAHDTYFYLGFSSSIRDSVARVLQAWSQEDPLFGFVLGQYAFGLEEAGELARAETVGRRALELNPDDAWAVHALAHVFEMAGRQEEGIAFLLTTSPNWKDSRWLAVHNWWHFAVYLIEVGRGAEVLPRYDTFIRDKIPEDSLLDLVDAAALLWRLELAGFDVADRWQDIARQWLTHADDHVLAFNDLHIALAVTRVGDAAGRARLRSSLERFLVHGAGDNREITADVGRDIVEAVFAFGERNFQRAIDLLLPVRHKWIRIGGSHAQRDLLTQTLIAAAGAAGHAKLARALLAERETWRPTHRTRQLQQAHRPA